MPRRKILALITILFSIEIFSLMVFLASGRRLHAETKVPECTWPNGTESADDTAAKREIRFAIYLVRDSDWAEERALNELALEEQPILTEQDIASYRISPDNRHFIRLKSGVKVQVVPSVGETLLDREFVVVADGNRIYLGDFHADVSSNLPKMAWIHLPMSRAGEAAELLIDIEISPCPIIDITGKPLVKDMRADPRILKALQDIGKLDMKPVPEGWGESQQAAKVRLVADKSRWTRGDEPSFKVEVLNSGNSELQIPIGPNACWLYVDGVGFKSAAEKDLGPLSPGGRHESTVILNSEIWRSNGKLPNLKLKPGKHKVWVMYDILGSPYITLRLLSNPVEIEIVASDKKK